MNIVQQIDEGHRTLVQKNKAVMTAIVRALLLCAKQNIATRGHTEDQSNFMAVLKLMTSDAALQDHLDNAPHNAKYTSTEIQNELLDI